MSRRSVPRDAGFTLIELLVSITILGLVMSGVATALFISFKTTTDSQVRLDQSNSEQFLAQNLVRDVAASCSHAASVAGSGPTCNRNPNPSIAAGSTACGTPVVFAMDLVTSVTGAAADTTVGYALQGRQLSRVTCAIGGSSPTSTINIASDIATITPSAPVSGKCKNQFEVDVVAAGSSAGLKFGQYSYTLCAHQRTG